MLFSIIESVWVVVSMLGLILWNVVLLFRVYCVGIVMFLMLVWLVLLVMFENIMVVMVMEEV